MANRSLLVRAVWFLLVGWWATFLVVNLAWVLMLSVVGIPLGIWLIDRVPFVQSLKEPRERDPENPPEQYPLVVRAVYFVLIGWWLSFLWGNAAAAISNTIIGLPVGYVMFNWLPFVTSLYRYDG